MTKFWSAGALAAGHDDVDIPRILTWVIDGGSVTPEPEGGLPDIVVHDFDNNSDDPAPPETFDRNFGASTVEARGVGTIVDSSDD